jgi:UDP-N-acetyl-D-mannosaminuronic acid dehydrogenase/UDP-N-acetyl-D-glucosamine dehydrogenase
VAQRLADLGADLHAVDPMLAAVDAPPGVQLVSCTQEEVAAADLIVVLTDHDDVDWDLLARYGDHVLDTRNRMVGAAVERL